MDIKKLYNLYKKSYTVSTDTRSIDKGSLFFALKGERFNGNTYAKTAIQKGASYAIIDEEKYAINDSYILVKDVLKTLQQLAKYHRKQLKIPFIGLTGSNGKTTTKELINAVLETKYNVCATKGNLNNHIGVPLTILSVDPSIEIAIIEMGANHLKEIKFLCAIAQPDFGYITNFGKAHLEGFGSEEGVIKGKSELYDYLRKNNKKVFLNPTDKRMVIQAKGIETILIDTEYTCIIKRQFIEIKHKTKTSYKLKSQLIGEYNLSNILAAISIGKAFDISFRKIKKGIESYSPSNNRSQKIKKDSNTIILDAYNANPSSMKAAITNFFAIETAKKKVLILGDMFELGIHSAAEHQNIVNTILDRNENYQLLVFGINFNNTIHDKSYVKYIDTNAFNENSEQIKDSYILIKGSRGMALEKILKYL